MGDAVAAFLDRYRLLGLDGSPCSDNDIALMEREANVALPAAYKAYLLVAGQNPPSAWVGSDCTINYLPKLAAWAEGLLAECNQPALPEQAFVFLMHQGYQFFYFISDGSSDDPPVFYYHEGEPETVKRFERFSDLVDICASDRNSA